MREVTHIIAEYISCKGARGSFTKPEVFIPQVQKLVKKSGLTAVGECVHSFPGGGLTCSVILAESHLNIHTWPERDFYLNLDISVCNYESDNFQKARILSKALKELFQPTDVNERVIVGYRDIEDSKYTEYFSKDYGFFVKPAKVLHKEDSDFQEIALYQSQDFGNLLRLDKYFQTSEKDEFFYHEPLVQPVMCTHPHPENVLIIGGGDGGTMEEVLKHNTVKKCVMVEIDGGVVELAKKHLQSIHKGCFNDDRAELIIGDGMKYIEETEQRFDVVILDLTDPVGPAKALYTEGFYRSIAAVMRNKEGMLSLHSEYPFLYPLTFGRIDATLRKVFSIVNHGYSFVPLYGQVMSFSYCSDGSDSKKVSAETIAERIRKRGLTHLQLYNAEMHAALQADPQYVKENLRRNHLPITPDAHLEEFDAVFNVVRGGIDDEH